MAKVLIGNFKGPQGDKGDKGDPGTAASIQVGTTQTVQPEENAEVTNSGTANVAVFNFKIPRGADGMTDLVAEYKDASEYTCQPTVNAPVVVKELDGKTEQVETTGAQLINPSETRSDSYSGLSMENLGDGEFKFSGANIAETGIIFHIKISQTLIPGTSYYLSVNNNKAVNDVSIRIYNDDTMVSNIIPELNEINKSVLFTIPDGSTGNRLTVRFAQSGTAEGGFTIKPMLSIGSSALPWEPYTGGQPAPSPDYPQVIKGVGGMGYFDGEWVQGNISSTGAIGTETTGITSANAIPCKQNDNIAVIYEDFIDVIAVAFYNASGAYISTSTSGNSVDTFTATAPANAASFKVNLRVVSGSTITPNGAKYCTVAINGEYQTGVETTGAQLFDAENATWYTNASSAEFEKTDTGVKFTTIKTIADAGVYASLASFDSSKTYQVSMDITVNNKNFSHIKLGISGDSSNTLNVNSSEITANAPYHINLPISNVIDSEYNFFVIYIDITGYSTGTVLTAENIMVSESQDENSWEPYHHTAISIPLTSPLYEGDKICYVKPGESYVDADGDTVVADGILYGCYRENATAVFDGSEDEAWTLEINNRYHIILNNSNNIYTENTAKCNFFKYNTNVYNDHGNEIGFIVLTDAFYCRFGSASEINSVSNLKAWLQSNPLTVVYRLAQPYFEPFSDQSIFYGLRTDDTLSYVYSTDPIEPILTVEVAKNSAGGYLLESYAQAQKNAISEASNASRLSAVETEIVALNNMRQELESVVLVTMN